MQSWNQLHQSEKAEAFFFTYERMKRYEGAWHLLEEPLFPGVIFLEYQEGTPSRRTDRPGSHERSGIAGYGNGAVSQGAGRQGASGSHVQRHHSKRHNDRDGRTVGGEGILYPKD